MLVAPVQQGLRLQCPIKRRTIRGFSVSDSNWKKTCHLWICLPLVLPHNSQSHRYLESHRRIKSKRIEVGHCSCKHRNEQQEGRRVLPNNTWFLLVCHSLPFARWSSKNDIICSQYTWQNMCILSLAARKKTWLSSFVPSSTAAGPFYLALERKGQRKGQER